MAVTRPTIRELVDQAWKLRRSVNLTSWLEEILTERGFDLRDPSNLELFVRLRSAVAQQLSARIGRDEDIGLVAPLVQSSIDEYEFIFRPNSTTEATRITAGQFISSLPWRTFEALALSSFKVQVFQTVG